MPEERPPLTVLFLCTGNSARSILAEALLRQRGAPRFRALSAGSFPAGRVHPGALARLAAAGVAADGLYSKSWDEIGASSPVDIVITVCDAAAGESCPAFAGPAVRAHWGIPDPAAAPDARQAAAFERAYATLSRRVEHLLALPLEDMTDSERAAAVQAIADGDPDA